MALPKSRGRGPKAMPPPTKIGARMPPWRARPVYFCMRVLRVLPCTSPRVFVLAVPARWLLRPRDERLVQDGLVRLDAEDAVVDFERAQLFAFDAHHGKLHFAAPRFVRRTRRSTPSLPGTAPFTMRMPLLESQRITRRFLTVALPVPM